MASPFRLRIRSLSVKFSSPRSHLSSSLHPLPSPSLPRPLSPCLSFAAPPISPFLPSSSPPPSSSSSSTPVWLVVLLVIGAASLLAVVALSVVRRMRNNGTAAGEGGSWCVGGAVSQ